MIAGTDCDDNDGTLSGAGTGMVTGRRVVREIVTTPITIRLWEPLRWMRLEHV